MRLVVRLRLAARNVAGVDDEHVVAALAGDGVRPGAADDG
jgi:hypothetical protein